MLSYFLPEMELFRHESFEQLISPLRVAALFSSTSYLIKDWTGIRNLPLSIMGKVSEGFPPSPPNYSSAAFVLGLQSSLLTVNASDSEISVALLSVLLFLSSVILFRIS